MPHFVFLLVAYFSCIATNAQQLQKSIALLLKTQKAIAALNNYSYDLVREYKYPSENYDVTVKQNVSFYKNEKDTLLGYNIYGFDKNTRFYYREQQGFSLIHKDSILQLDKKLDSTTIAYKSFVSYSIIAIAKLIPQVIQQKNAVLTTTDSSINGKKYYKLKVVTKQGYFDFYRLAAVADKDFVREIFLLIDANTYLPYQYFAQFRVTTYGVDFARNTYSNIKTTTTPLTDKEWEPGYYMPPYKIELSNASKLIATGATFPTTNLQKYLPNGSTVVNTSAYQNNKTIFYFWIKSCGPCVASFPKLIALQKKYKTKGVDVVMVNCFDKEKDIAFFYKKHHPNFAMLYNGLELQNKMGVWFYPTVIIIDALQKVLYSGGWDEDLINKVL
jgi:thiol-disulfide isomerase/thioredoxin